MPHIKRRDGTKQYVGTGRGTPVVFVHEYAVDCLESSVFLKRTVPTAGLVVLPRWGHTSTSEESAFNGALADLFANVEAGRWMGHRGV